MEPFNVKMVAELLGVSPHTLRAWERRYGAITPQRSGSGRRQYTPGEVERLKLLTGLVRQGHRIGDIAALPDGQLRRLKRHAGEASPGPRHERALAALMDFRLSDLAREVAWAQAAMSARNFALSIVTPLAETMKPGTAHERALTSILRDQVAPLLRLLREQPPTVVLATAESDTYELGMLIAVLLCAHHRVPACYLGPGVPPGVLGEVQPALGASVTVVGNRLLYELTFGESARGPHRSRWVSPYELDSLLADELSERGSGYT